MTLSDTVHPEMKFKAGTRLRYTKGVTTPRHSTTSSHQKRILSRRKLRPALLYSIAFKRIFHSKFIKSKIPNPKSKMGGRFSPCPIF